jgi:hypothetical protein
MAKPVEIQSLHGKSAVKSFLQGYLLPNARTFVNVVQHLRDFARFEMNLDRILIAEEEILHEIENQPGTILGVLQIS